MTHDLQLALRGAMADRALWQVQAVRQAAVQHGLCDQQSLCY